MYYVVNVCSLCLLLLFGLCFCSMAVCFCLDDLVCMSGMFLVHFVQDPIENEKVHLKG